MKPAAPDVSSLLAQGMGQGLHWFPEDAPVSRLSLTLAGMANSGGGVVILGVAPRSSIVHGVQQPAEALDRVFQAALLVDPPLVLPVPRLVLMGEKSVLVIEIPRGLPYVYSLDGRYVGREGAQTNPLTAQRLRQLLVERGVIQFEARQPPNTGLDDLDMQKVTAYLQALNLPGIESAEQILLRRGCLQPSEGRLHPTYAALLLFGNYPQRWLPNASILAARFAGPTLADEFIKQEISGALPDQLRQAEAFMQANLRRVVRLVGLSHQETSEYPLEAVRELLVNAVAHRDYNVQGDNIHLYLFSDRLEIHSPGALPGPVNLENLLEARFSRNPVLMQVLSDLGFVERLGYGLDRVVSVMHQNGLRSPRFEETAGTFRVTLFNDLPSMEVNVDLARYQEPDLNPRQKLALNHLARLRRITNRDYQELCPTVHAETLRRDLADLVERGILLKIGDKRSTYYILKKIPARDGR